MVSSLNPGQQPAPSTAPDSRIRPWEPEPFDGDRTKYRTWKSQELRYLTAARNLTRHQRITILLANIRGPRVDDWVNAFTDLHFDSDRGAWGVTIDDLWQDLDQAFTDRVGERQVLDKLEHLRQGNRPATDFFQEFEMLIMQAGYKTDEKFALEWVKRGINSRYIDSIYSVTPLPADYEAWKARVILLDDAWAQRQALHAHTPRAPQVPRPQASYPRVPAAADPRMSQPTQPAVQTRADATGITYGGRGQPMDLDRNTCYQCRKPRWNAAPGCANTWHRTPRAMGQTSAAPTSTGAVPVRTRAVWEEEGFAEHVRKWAEESPDAFKAAGFGFGSA